eukprot:TRINITY_DN3925_c0_g1_i2.p1 TRINITY_DN3925_c0_g1~~TRINITY_DN3925_c0_g1_i2.p1  ORF type:complete len:145 (-),score=87.14 TRINITY_DN3925_c0_g1_i2:600-1034(-)
MVSAGLYEAAEQQIKQGIFPIAGPFPEAILELSTALAGQERWEEALALLSAAIDETPSDAQLTRHLGWLRQQQRHQQQQRSEEARQRQQQQQQPKQKQDKEHEQQQQQQQQEQEEEEVEQHRQRQQQEGEVVQQAQQLAQQQAT